MALRIDNTDNVTDDATLQLDDAIDVATAVVGGVTYLFAAGRVDDGVSVFSVAADGTLTNVDNVTDDHQIGGGLELGGARAVATAVVSGTTYLFVAGLQDDGLSVFSVAADGTLTNVANVTDDHPIRGVLELDGAIDVATAVVSGNPYLFAAGTFDSGLSVFHVAADGTLTNVDNVTDGGTLELNGVLGLTTAVVGGTTYLFAGGLDDGVSVFAVAANGTLANVANITDDATLELDDVFGMTTAVVGGTTYLFVTGAIDDGVSVFAVAADGTLTNVDNVTDAGVLELDAAVDVATAVVGGTTYLFAAGSLDDGVSVFSVAADGTLTNVANLTDNPAVALDGAGGVTTAVVGGVTYLFVTGIADDGVSVFALTETVPPLGDVLWQHSDGTVAIAAHDLPAVPDTWQVVGTGDFDRDGDSDIVWHHDQGSVVTWDMENGTLWATHDLGVVGTSWQISGTGDFDGDGDADILWRHDDGQAVIWEMENGTYVVNHNLPQVSNSFHIAGTGDFDGDGDADILWRHDEGQVVTWEMENGTYVVNHNLPEVSNSFHIAGTGDFDDDGDADILWLHDEGMTVTWEMEDGAFSTNHSLANVGTGWQIAGTEDFDSDGDADILWRHDSGSIVTWEMEDGAYVVNHNIDAMSEAWQIRGTGEFDLV